MISRSSNVRSSFKEPKVLWIVFVENEKSGALISKAVG